MSLLYALRGLVCVLVSIWFFGLCLAIMLGISRGYIRHTKAWLLWLLRNIKRWLLTVAQAAGRWLIKKARDW